MARALTSAVSTTFLLAFIASGVTPFIRGASSESTSTSDSDADAVRGTCANTDRSKCRDVGNDCCVSRDLVGLPEAYSCADGYVVVVGHGGPACCMPAIVCTAC